MAKHAGAFYKELKTGSATPPFSIRLMDNGVGGKLSNQVLVTGGAGYIGSHACLRLAEAGFEPVVFDNLANGHDRFVQWGALVRGDIRDREAVRRAFEHVRPAAVMHFAALIEVGESVKHPGRFFETNVGGAANIIQASLEAGVRALVFSSTCATYGDPVHMPMSEEHPQNPVNPYGRSKLLVEQMLTDADRYCGLRSITLRYFNAAGCDPEGRIGERHDPETHAIPLAVRTALGRGEFRLFGTDYDTRDGTAVRDYIHVLDLADAHVLALKRLLDGGSSDVFNLGTGEGTTVREVIEAIQRVSGRPFPVLEAPRRSGDAPMLVANCEKAHRVLGWRPRYCLDDIVSHAWDWHSRHEAAVFKSNPSLD